MNESPGDESPKSAELEIAQTKSPPFLQRVDRASFAFTTFLTLAVYLFTLSPSIELGFSGIYATGSMYLGVPHPSGFPLWTLYSHLFTWLPFSNMAWRVNLATAVASALVCGLVSLLCSRTCGAMLKDLAPSRCLDPTDEQRMRFVCGCVAGLVFGFDAAFWNYAVVAGPWNFSILLFVLTLTALVRWQHTPERYRWFYTASLLFGMTLSNSQAFIPAGTGIAIFIVSAKPDVGRDVLGLATVLIILLVIGNHFNFVAWIIGNLITVFLILGLCALVSTLILIIVTCAFFTNGRMVLIGTLLFILGLAPYLLIPIFSMANPPMNWGYPRTIDGFFHVLSRGQYERANPSLDLAGFGESLRVYFISTHMNFGLLYIGLALIPFLFIHRFQAQQRRWLYGMLGILLSLAFFMLYLMNPSDDRASTDLHAHFFTPSHLIFSILAGCGLAILAVLFCESKRP